MTDGVIDVDMAGSGARGFYNTHFRTQGDGNGEEAYLRPHKTGLDDAQQYTPTVNGASVWQIYNGPGFTRAVDIPRGVWFHVRLEITGAQAKLYVSDTREPSLVMNDLKSGIRKGGVALAGAASFSNFESCISRHLRPPCAGAMIINHLANELNLPRLDYPFLDR